MSTISKPILRIVHRLAGGAAFCLIASFWLATIIVELFGTTDQIVMVKTAIVWGLLALVPCLAATGGSGFTLARGQIAGLVAVKLRRMKLIAANGLLVLVPCAIGLAILARNGQMDDVFITLQDQPCSDWPEHPRWSAHASPGETARDCVTRNASHFICRS